MNILLVEDDQILGEGIVTALRRENHAVDWFEEGKSALVAALAGRYDLIVLDLGLPIMAGMDVLGGIRKNNCYTPVLILTARDTVADKISGLDAGADDYLTKPFQLGELFARIRALGRRNTRQAGIRRTYGDLEMQDDGHRVSYQGSPIDLSRREYCLLSSLLDSPGKVFSRQQLQDEIYTWNEAVESNAIEVHIHHLRKKLHPGLIKTIRGVGYTLERPGEAWMNAVRCH